INEQSASALAAERVHVERVSRIERLARATHIDMVERWLVPFAQRPQREHQLEDRVTEVRQEALEFAELAPVDPEEPAITRELLVAVALWSNRVNQAVVSADGPAATAALRDHLDAIGSCVTRLTDVISRAGSSTDRRLIVLRGRQAALQ